MNHGTGSGFSSRTERIDPRDIRTLFALKRFDDSSKMHEKPNISDWPPKFENHRSFDGHGALYPAWNNITDFPMHSGPMTVQTFEDFDSDVSSQGSAGSTGGQPLRATREPRVHHIPILVEARDDNSSGYASDNTAEQQQQEQKKYSAIPSRTSYNSADILYPKPKQLGGNQGQKPCTRSYSDTLNIDKKPEKPPRGQKSASQPPLSPPAKDTQTHGQFVTKVDIKTPMPAPVNQRSNKKPVSDPLVQIKSVLNELQHHQEEVEAFQGTSKDKNYRYLDEMLTRCMLKLDDVNTEGNDNVRLERKEAVRKIQGCISLLESKISAATPVRDLGEQSCEAQATEDGHLNENGSGDCYNDTSRM